MRQMNLTILYINLNFQIFVNNSMGYSMEFPNTKMFDQQNEIDPEKKSFTHLIWKWAILIILFYPLFNLVIQFFFSFQIQEDPEILFDHARYSNLSIFIYSLLQTHKNLSRIQQQYKYWGKDFNEVAPNSRYLVGSPINLQGIPMHKTKVSHELLPFEQLIFLFFDGLDFFLRNNKTRWILRTTEDSFINYRELQSFQEELEKKYDPLKDIVMIGQLCEYSLFPPRAFIHGGSGWIMSRKAAQLYLEHKDQQLEYLANSNHYGDDVVTQMFIDKYQLPYEDIHSQRFLGTKLDDESVKMLITNRYHLTPECPPNPIDMPITRAHIPFYNLINWHSGRRDVISIVEGWKILSHVPHNIYVFLENDHSSICVNKSAEMWTRKKN